jgi:hypothetical protein
MNIRKSLAGIAVGSLALAGVSVVGASSAQAGSLPAGTAWSCSILGSSNGWESGISIAATPGTINAGQSVSLSVSGMADNYSGPVEVDPGALRTVIKLQASGTAVGAAPVDIYIAQADGSSVSPAGIGTWTAFNPGTVTGSYTPPNSGTLEFKVQAVIFDYQANGVYPTTTPTAAQPDTTCTPWNGSIGTTITFVDKAGDSTLYTGGPYAGTEIRTWTVASVSAAPKATTPTTTVTVQGPEVQISPLVGRPGDTITASNTASGAPLWGANGAATVTVGGIAAPNNTVAVTSGLVGGTFDIPAIGAGSIAAGSNPVVISANSVSKTMSLDVLGNASATTDKTSGVVSDTVVISGTDFDPNSTVTITPSGAGSAYTVTTNGSGDFSSNFTVIANLTGFSIVGVQAGSATTPVVRPFSINAFNCVAETASGPAASACITKQKAFATVNAGTLRQDAIAKKCLSTDTWTISYKPFGPTGPEFWAATCTTPAAATADNLAIQLGSVTTSTQVQYLGASLNQVQVQDTRGAVDANGWSLTAVLDGNFVRTNGGGAIPASKAIIAGQTCVSNGLLPTGAGGSMQDYSAAATAGSANFLGSSTTGALNTVTLCQQAAGTAVNTITSSTGGSWLADAKLQLQIPAFQREGEYTSTLQITLA